MGATGTAGYDVWAVFNSMGSLTSRQLQGDGIDQHLAYVQGGTALWYLTDHLGSTRATINNSGTVQDSLTYDAYGNLTDSTPTARPLYSYTGRQVDVETGLQYNRARWYDAATGRWISQDPLGFDAGDSNLYRYVNNRPTIDTDPSGLWSPDEVWPLLDSRAKKAWYILKDDSWRLRFNPGQATGLRNFPSEKGSATIGVTDASGIADMKKGLDLQWKAGAYLVDFSNKRIVVGSGLSNKHE